MPRDPQQLVTASLVTASRAIDEHARKVIGLTELVQRSDLVPPLRQQHAPADKVARRAGEPLLQRLASGAGGGRPQPQRLETRRGDRRAIELWKRAGKARHHRGAARAARARQLAQEGGELTRAARRRESRAGRRLAVGPAKHTLLHLGAEEHAVAPSDLGAVRRRGSTLGPGGHHLRRR